MKGLLAGFAIVLLSSTPAVQSREEARSVPLVGNRNIVSVNVECSEETYLGRPSLKVIDTAKDTEVTFAMITNLNFHDGSIELDVAGKPAADAPEGARGFVGVAFRIQGSLSKFECFYLRPTNGRAEDQTRRNHAVQYISYPDFPWYKLRQNFPGEYESYVDLIPGAWTKIRIVVRGEKASLYVHGASQPTLIVNDLKHGPGGQGPIGLWIGPGTEAYFSNLKIAADAGAVGKKTRDLLQGERLRGGIHAPRLPFRQGLRLNLRWRDIPARGLPQSPRERRGCPSGVKEGRAEPSSAIRR